MPDWAVFLAAVVSPILSFIGLTLGIRANRKMSDAIAEKREAESKDISATATDRLVDTALGLNEPLRLALKNEREIFNAALADERAARKEESVNAQNQITALQLIVNQNSKDLHELRADYEWLMRGATALSHQVQSLNAVPVFNVNERRKQ